MSDTVPDCDTVTVGRITLECPSCYNGFGFATLRPIKSRLRSAWKFSNVWKYMSSTQMSKITKFKSPKMWYLVVYQRKPTRLYGGGRVKFLGSRVSCVANLLTALVYQESSLLYSITIVQCYTAVTMSWCEKVGGVCDSTQKSVSEIFVVLPNFCLKIVIF